MDQEFSGEIIEWRGPAPYYFVPVPSRESAALRAAASTAGYNSWGMLPIRAQLGSTEWKTSLWSKDGGYWLPLKDAVRKPDGLDAGDTVDLRLTFDAPARRPTKARRVPVPRTTSSREPVTDEQLTIVPANQATAADLEAIFGTGDPARCSCQRFRMLPKESWASEGPEELAARLRDQTACGNPEAEATSGLIAYLDEGDLSRGGRETRPGEPGGGGREARRDEPGGDDQGVRRGEPGRGDQEARRGEPVGWCAVAPRADHPRLRRDHRVPWLGRDEDKADGTVWAVTCFVTRAGYRRRGIGAALARATVGFARDRGARAVEGYPDFVDGGSVGTLAMFTDAGYVEVSRPGNRRAVVRVDF